MTADQLNALIAIFVLSLWVAQAIDALARMG